MWGMRIEVAGTSMVVTRGWLGTRGSRVARPLCLGSRSRNRCRNAMSLYRYVAIAIAVAVAIAIAIAVSLSLCRSRRDRRGLGTLFARSPTRTLSRKLL